MDVVIVGAGLGGAKTAEALREQGFEGSIRLIGQERHLPYERPPLSKQFFNGEQQQPDFTVHPQEWYEEHSVGLDLSTRVSAVDLARRVVTVADGEEIGWDVLVLATGSRSRRPDLPGLDAEGVYLVRTVDESAQLSAAITPDSHLVIVGGGWIGLEIAAGARSRGAQVTVVHREEQPLLGPLGPEMGGMFADLHREHGVELILSSNVRAITTEHGRATGVELDDGRQIGGDLVLVAAGAVGNTELAADAGLDMGAGGVLVDAGLRTSHADVYAVGDIAAWQHPFYGRRIRSEHWANALNQPAVAAANILGGDDTYSLLPYFFTDQYDLGMEYSGHSAGAEQVVVRGDVGKRELIAFWLDEEDHVLAGMNVNVWDVTDAINALITSGRPVDPVKLADPDVPLAEVAS